MTESAHDTLAASAEPGVRVRTHPGLCLGWGNCHRFAPDVYPLDEEGHVAVHLLDVPAELAYDAWLGAGACPEQAITVIGRPSRFWADRRAEERARRTGHEVETGRKVETGRNVETGRKVETGRNVEAGR
jgi:ferredoxin